MIKRSQEQLQGAIPATVAKKKEASDRLLECEMNSSFRDRSKMIDITVRITPALYLALEAFAEESGREIGDIVEDWIVDSVPAQYLLRDTVNGKVI